MFQAYYHHPICGSIRQQTPIKSNLEGLKSRIKKIQFWVLTSISALFFSSRLYCLPKWKIKSLFGKWMEKANKEAALKILKEQINSYPLSVIDSYAYFTSV